jgi:flagellar motor component MotA
VAKKHFHNAVTIITIVLAFLFLALSVVFKGVTHDIFLEAALFLVSVKIILGMVQISNLSKVTEHKLDTLLAYFKVKEEEES